MQVIQDIVEKSKWELKCPHAMTPEFIVIHNTANDASAKNEITNMKNNTSSTSFHFAVDETEARQGIPLDRNSWNAGDGKEGAGNRKGISIEICYSKSGGTKFKWAEERCAEFVAQLLKQYGWGIDKVKKHQDFSEKYCPHRTLDLGWDRFLEKIEKYMPMELTTVNDIVWELSARGIISDAALWMEKLEEDKNSYWLARKCINYIKNKEK